jgi:dTDP-4-dehydrorhamnose 3,5-epimerase
VSRAVSRDDSHIGMRILETCLPGLVLLGPRVHGDERGFFLETYSAADWSAAGLPPHSEFVQDNHSRSRLGTVRGLHFQTHPGQGKLVRCARGSVVDVVVDLRRGSPTFGRWESFVLDDIEAHQLWVPVGFAHGFCVTSEVADFVYKTTSYYDPATEGGFRFDDPEVGVIWPDMELLYSERDRTAPLLSEIASELPFTFST